MRRRVTAVLGAAALVGSLAGGALAGWRDAVALSADLTLGYVHYAVGDPAASGPLQDEAHFTDADGAPGWTLPARVLTDLTPAQPQTAVVQVDGYAQGNRGLSYRLPAMDVTGDDSLLAVTDLRIVTVQRPSQCTPHLPDKPVEPGEPVPANPDPLAAFPLLYDGPALDASFADRELVAPGDLERSTGAETWRRESRTQYLCLELSLPGLRYENTASVTAVVPGTDPFPVTDTDTWAADVEPTPEQRAAEVTLRLPYRTYRAGGEVDRALAVEIAHTTTPGKPSYAVGDRLTFTYTVTNHTGVSRSTERVTSNLTGDGACRWVGHAPQHTDTCTFGYHVLTQTDLDRGAFTPTATWVIRNSADYTSGVLATVRVSGEPVPLPTP